MAQKYVGQEEQELKQHAQKEQKYEEPAGEYKLKVQRLTERKQEGYKESDQSQKE